MKYRTLRPCALFSSAVLAAVCLLGRDAHAQSAGPFADRLQACALRHPVTSIPRLADLPPAIRAALLKGGAMAEKGGRFNATDVITLHDPTPRTRFMRAGQWQNLVYVWYEAGGIALFHRLAVFRLDANGTAQRITDISDDFHDPCALTDAALDGAPR